MNTSYWFIAFARFFFLFLLFFRLCFLPVTLVSAGLKREKNQDKNKKFVRMKNVQKMYSLKEHFYIYFANFMVILPIVYTALKGQYRHDQQGMESEY